jgi:hypothetical protein
MKRVALLNRRWDGWPLAKNQRSGQPAQSVSSARCAAPPQLPLTRASGSTVATPGRASATTPNYGLMVHHETQVQVIDQISAAPWEGLYLEPSEGPVDSTASGHRPNPELERFLTALMYGE